MKSQIIALSLLTLPVWANYSPIPKNENISALLEGQVQVTSLKEIERLGLTTGSSDLDIWSGSYWPFFQGLIAARYRDPVFSNQMRAKSQWDKNKELFDKSPIYTYSGREENLSAAEKYDLLIGDDKMSLTNYSWKLGEKSAVAGEVKTWRGVCDGWAAAAQSLPRPKKTVTLKSPSGQPITFFPEDIKALGTLMYSRSLSEVIFLGKRCRSQITGIFTKSCKETNPAAFHLALVNRVGKLKKSFIADVSPGNEVWNYPIIGYKFAYYNVMNDSESQKFNDVKELFIKKNNFVKPGQRHEKTAAIVGVKLVVQYRDMRDANTLETDSKEQDKILEKTYYYDLELDSQDNVIGGESMSKNLPDFIWATADITYPISDAEELNPKGTLVELSREASMLGQPLSRIVKELFEKSK